MKAYQLTSFYKLFNFLGVLRFMGIFDFVSLDSGFNNLSPSHFCPHQHTPSELIIHTPEPQHLLSSIAIN